MTGDALKMMLKHSIHQKTKYVDEFDLPNLVCTGFDPVISRRESCHKHVQHTCRGEEREGRRHGECVSGRRKSLPSASITCAGLIVLRYQPLVQQEITPK